MNYANIHNILYLKNLFNHFDKIYKIDIWKGQTCNCQKHIGGHDLSLLDFCTLQIATCGVCNVLLKLVQTGPYILSVLKTIKERVNIYSMDKNKDHPLYGQF